jgi:2-hydroxychromene-2-carboxylate isomerase
MPRTVQYWFTLVSPWAYLGHGQFMDIVARHGLTVDWRPVNLANVFPETGGLPLPRRAPARQRYRIMELQRWRDRRGVPLRLHPKHWPFPVELADRTVIAIVRAGRDPSPFVLAAMRGVWFEERDLGDEATLAGLLGEAGFDGKAMLEAARAHEIGLAYEENARIAVAGDIFGSPTYVLDGEIFWGQDRLDLLDEALTKGRGPFRADAKA